MDKHDERVAALEDLYARVPSGYCKGLCQNICGPLPMVVAEAKRLRRNGTPIPHEDDAMAQWEATEGHYCCPNLQGDGRCGVYEIRPLICRLYGTVENMKCEHGCIPDGGFLSVEQGQELVETAVRVGGGMR